MLQSLHLSRARQATWLELFFDLVFVAVIGVVAHDLSHTHQGHMGLAQLLRFPLVFIPVWWIWATHTLYANRFDNNDRTHRLFALVIMGLLVLLSTCVDGCLGGKFHYFVLIYAGIRFLLAGLYFRIHANHKGSVGFARQMGQSIAFGALFSVFAVMLSGPWKFVVFYGGIVADMIFQLQFREKVRSFPVDRKHLVERTGLLAIIILGESVISMVNGLPGFEGWDKYAMLSVISGFIMIWAIWWIYFDSFDLLEHAKRIIDGGTLMYTHLILCMGLLILASLIGHAIQSDLDRGTFRLLAIVGMVGFYLGKQVIYYLCFAPFRKMIIINTLVCLAITVASTYLPRIEYSLLGITFSMLFYLYSTFNWLLPNDISGCLGEAEQG